MDHSGTLPNQDVFYSPPMRGRLAPRGLGTAAGTLVYGGGLPSNPRGSEPSGDAGEGRDVPWRDGRTDDDSFKLHANLPSANALDYVHKASSATLLVLALGILIIYGVLRPRRALSLLEGRAGGGA